MNKTVIALLCIVLFGTVQAFAAPFSPSVMEITVPSIIQYDFDGTLTEVPMTVTGAPGSAIFFIFTKDKAEEITEVRNGYLGWHYVNKVDTCVYIGGTTAFEEGENSILWDGYDNEGAIVPAGEYTYYIYAYDDQSLKIPASRYMTMGRINRAEIITHDADGAPLERPEWYTSLGNSGDPSYINPLQKWVIGSDPEDDSLVETTTYPIWGSHIEVDPLDNAYFYLWCPDRENVVGRVGKFMWVPNGEAEIQTDWGEDSGFAIYDMAGASGIANETMADLAQIGDYVIVGFHDNTALAAMNGLAYVRMDDGIVEQVVDVSERWYHPEDEEAGAQAHGGPTQLVDRNGYLIMSRFNACYREMVDPLNDPDEDFVVWGNGNGDYVGDHNFDEDSQRPWVCFDYAVAPYAYVTDADANLFSSFGAYDMGAVSFGLIAPDGTGVDYFAFLGETASIKAGTVYIDYGSSYDGLYTDNQSTGSEDDAAGLWYVAHTSVKGIISSQPVAVEDDAPAAFTVAQNSPNPFNPETSIQFTLDDAAAVSIEIYNAAGQKVDTLLNEQKSAGSHRVVWDGSAFSAGVYFYTVKTDGHSKTMKMTLLK